MAIQVQVRRDSAADWTSNDPTPLSGEICYETDTGKFKIGDGSTAWTSLSYTPVPAASVVAGTFGSGNYVIDGDLEVNQHITFDAEVDNGNSGAADTIDWGAGNKQMSTLTDNCTFTFTAPDGVGNFLLKLVQDGTGSRTVTWPATVKWPAGTAPTLTTDAAGVDIVTFYWDGTNYFGNASLAFAVPA